MFASKMEGVTREDFERKMGKKLKNGSNRKDVVINTDFSLTKQLGRVLKAIELKRIKGTKKLTAWPMEWQNDKCTGVPLNLYRVKNALKVDKETGEKGLNPNYGRFYFALFKEKVDGDGKTVMQEGGKWPETELSCFQWFEETLYSQLVFGECVHPDVLMMVLTMYGSHIANTAVGGDPPDLWGSRVRNVLLAGELDTCVEELSAVVPTHDTE